MRPRIAAILFVVTACTAGDTSAPDNTSAGDPVIIVSGNDQLGAVRTTLEAPLIAEDFSGVVAPMFLHA